MNKFSPIYQQGEPNLKTKDTDLLWNRKWGGWLQSQVVLRIISELEKRKNKTQSIGKKAGRNESGSRFQPAGFVYL